MKRKDVTVQIMLGGKSTRMGRDKALVELGGKTLLERALARWGNYGAALQLSVGGAQRAGLAPEGIAAVTDRYPDRGPLSGLHAGLLVCETPLLLLTAVDCPFLGPEQADHLLAELDGVDACIYEVEGRPQPLFGLYRTDCAGAAESLLAEGNNRMGSLLERVETRIISGGDRALFRNLNTPEELAEAELLLARKDYVDP